MKNTTTAPLTAMTFTHSFTDAYGAKLKNAVMQINSANAPKTCNLEVLTNAADGYSRSGSEHSNLNVTYDVIYWINQAAKEAGALPMPYKYFDKSEQSNATDTASGGSNYQAGDTHFYFDGESHEINSVSQLESTCVKHFKKEILHIADIVT